MLKSIFTLDYEIHGNGEGSPYALMVEPTSRMLELFESHGAKLTIMADVAEILKFREYRDHVGRDDFYYEAIVNQLKDAIRRGHDVQLHLHCSYFNSRYEDGRWLQDWSEYNFAELSEQRLNKVVQIGKEFLEEQLRPIDFSYQCNVFRAANWAMNPSRNAVRALLNNGFKIDTSVFKYGRRTGLVNFNYGSAPSGLVPWEVEENDICVRNPNGGLMEYPIYSENRWVGSFLTPQRVYRAALSCLHKLSVPVGTAALQHSSPASSGLRRGARFRRLKWRHAWKADFNQCSGRQLISALNRGEAEYDSSGRELPFVLIGHSKLFTRFTEWSLRPFLTYVAERPERFGFARFRDFDQHRANELLQGTPIGFSSNPSAA